MYIYIYVYTHTYIHREIFLAVHVDRVIGLPNHFPYQGLVHPITLDLCAAKFFLVKMFVVFFSSLHVEAGMAATKVCCIYICRFLGEDSLAVS